MVNLILDFIQFTLFKLYLVLFLSHKSSVKSDLTALKIACYRNIVIFLTIFQKSFIIYFFGNLAKITVL